MDALNRRSHFCLPCIACDFEVYGLFYFGFNIEAMFFVMVIFREIFGVSGSNILPLFLFIKLNYLIHRN